MCKRHDHQMIMASEHMDEQRLNENLVNNMKTNTAYGNEKNEAEFKAKMHTLLHKLCDL